MKRKRTIHHFGEWAAIIVLIILLAPACATKRYWGPTMGRSADSQFTPADALEKALKPASFDRYRGKTVWIDAFTLTEHTGEESAEERFLRHPKFNKFSNPLILVWFSRNPMKMLDKFRSIRFLSVPVYSTWSGLFELCLAQI